MFAPARAETPAVGIVRSTEWSPADPAREGAGEFEVWLRVAQLQREHSAAGLVAVGNGNGVLRSGGERALRHVVLNGVVVVRVAARGEVARTPDDLFVDAGALNAEHAASLLARCLARYGAPPCAADADRPSAREIAAVHAHLEKFRTEFAAAQAVRVAQR